MARGRKLAQGVKLPTGQIQPAPTTLPEPPKWEVGTLHLQQLVARMRENYIALAQETRRLLKPYAKVFVDGPSFFIGNQSGHKERWRRMAPADRSASLKAMRDARDKKYPREPVAERFAKFCEPEPNSGCWLWTGTRSRLGYGQFGTRYAKGLHTPIAHRVSYLLNVGPITEGTELHHVCQNRCCVNPQHLRPVSHAENMALSKPALSPYCFRGHLLRHRPNGKGRVCDECRKLRSK